MEMSKSDLSQMIRNLDISTTEKVDESLQRIAEKEVSIISGFNVDS